MLSSQACFFTFPLLLCFLLSTHVPESDAINCFVCNSRNDPQCEFLLKNDTQSYQFVRCNEFTETGEPPFCRKIVQYIKDYDIYRVVRKCGYRRHHKDCYTVRNADHDETVCQCFDDGCNSGSSMAASAILLGLSLLGVAIKTIVF